MRAAQRWPAAPSSAAGTAGPGPPLKYNRALGRYARPRVRSPQRRVARPPTGSRESRVPPSAILRPMLRPWLRPPLPNHHHQGGTPRVIRRMGNSVKRASAATRAADEPSSHPLPQGLTSVRAARRHGQRRSPRAVAVSEFARRSWIRYFCGLSALRAPARAPGSLSATSRGRRRGHQYGCVHWVGTIAASYEVQRTSRCVPFASPASTIHSLHLAPAHTMGHHSTSSA